MLFGTLDIHQAVSSIDVEARRVNAAQGLHTSQIVYDVGSSAVGILHLSAIRGLSPLLQQHVCVSFVSYARNLPSRRHMFDLISSFSPERFGFLPQHKLRLMSVTLSSVYEVYYHSRCT